MNCDVAARCPAKMSIDLKAIPMIGLKRLLNMAIATGIEN
jgi:hypothetical protein